MLKLIASMSLAALLSLSPALAHETAPEVAQKCSPPAEVLKVIRVKPLTQITKPEDIAEFVTNFNSYVAQNGGPKNLLGSGIDLVLFFPRPDHAVLYVTFVNGCAKTMGSFGLDAVDALIGKSNHTPSDKPADDGKI